MLQLQNGIIARLLSSRPLPLAFPPILGIVNSIGVGIGGRAFHSSTVLSSIRAHVPEGTSKPMAVPFLEDMTLKLGEPVPRGIKAWYYTLPSIHSSDFFDSLENLLKQLHNDLSEQFSIIIQPNLSNGQTRTLGHSFTTNIQPNMDYLKEWLTPLIENFEAQSASGEGIFTDSTRVAIRNVTDLPEPQATPISSSSANVKAIKDTKKAIDRERKRLASPSIQSQTLDVVNLISTNLNASMATQTALLKELIAANKSSPVPQQMSSTDWTPLISAIAALCSLTPLIVVKYLGLDPEILKTSISTPSKTPSALDLESIKSDLTSQLETKINGMQKEIHDLQSQYTNLQSDMHSMHKTLSSLDSKLDHLVALVTPSSTGSSDSSDSTPSSSNGSSTPPATPSSAASSPSTSSTPSKNSPPTAPPTIKALDPYDIEINLNNSIVTADLEALIDPSGNNLVYMAAWYNGIDSKVFDITQWGYDTNTMLEQFWISLITSNIGKNCYFHNWGGYDSILSLSALLNLPGYKYLPILNNGEIMSMRISDSNGKELLQIMDSIRLLPSSLGKLAKDWKVETQKDHFPHYFFLNSIQATLNYVGPIPNYSYFESKRTSLADYEAMELEFSTHSWSFLEVSKTYIMADVKALYQIMIKFFNTLFSKFPIDPLSVLSAPSTAFKIWRTVQLPKLNKDLLEVYDLSRNLDSQFRQAYCGGIVDVYKPHLIGEGYYYDVNSLYPTAMCRSMPVGKPTLTNLPVEEFLDGYFFGYLEATVKAPLADTPSGYIGLLPLKYKGRLICPGGTFTSTFFSEELYFALNNGYTLLSIQKAYRFKRGDNTFKELIFKLNDMKVQAQLDNKPTIRNLAKLLMNSMYGRFGMHTDDLRYSFLNEAQITKLSRDYIIKEVLPFGELSLVTYTLNQSNWNVGTKLEQKLKQHKGGLSANTNVAIAAAVTSYSRMIINQYKLNALKLGMDIYYSDTDSLVVNQPLPSEYCDSAQLGLLKLEYKFREGIFVMPKVYLLELEDGTIITKCKGYSGKLSKAQYLDLLGGKSINLQVTKWFRSLKKSTIQIQQSTPYSINFQFNKRQQVFNNGIWINTAPRILPQ